MASVGAPMCRAAWTKGFRRASRTSGIVGGVAFWLLRLPRLMCRLYAAVLKQFVVNR
jgi:hypothetical protein